MEVEFRRAVGRPIKYISDRSKDRPLNYDLVIIDGRHVGYFHYAVGSPVQCFRTISDAERAELKRAATAKYGGCVWIVAPRRPIYYNDLEEQEAELDVW